MTDSTDPPQATGEAAADVYHQHFTVRFDYPVHFTRGVFSPGNPLLASVLNRLGEDRRHRAGVFVDGGLADAQGDLLKRIGEYFHAHRAGLTPAAPPRVVPGGEAVKTGWSAVRDVMTTIGDCHLDRQSFVVAVGGGAALDMIGFAASLVHRGLRLVRVPTTVLAQNDAGVGVKNGMDEHGVKNFVGTFAPPFAVINDFDFLGTLAQRDWIGGIAEAFKVAIIKDAGFFEWLCSAAGDLRRRDAAAMETLIRRCAVLHLDHIRTAGDPFEFGSARPLDFGHWVGHRLESLSEYRIGHGQAAAVGIAVDSFYACRGGLIDPGELERILDGLTAAGLPIFSELLVRRSGDGELVILAGLEQFREHLGGRLSITLPDGIGGKVEVHHIGAEVVAEAVAALGKRAGR